MNRDLTAEASLARISANWSCRESTARTIDAVVAMSKSACAGVVVIGRSFQLAAAYGPLSDRIITGARISIAAEAPLTLNLDAMTSATGAGSRAIDSRMSAANFKPDASKTG